MLVIRLQRVGKKHQPSYRIVVAERRSKLCAFPVEDCGSYNPFTKKANVEKEKIAHWIKVGAQPSVTVHNLLVREQALSAPKIAVKVKAKKKKEAAPAGTTPSAAAPAAAAVPVAAAEKSPAAETAGKAAAPEAS